MTSAFVELHADEILEAGIPLTVEDLRYGLERGFIKPPDSIRLASAAVSQGADDPLMLDLASLLLSEADRVGEVLAATADPERIHDPRESARKWLYLELRALYNIRDRVHDPFAVVEDLYSSFDYPDSIRGLVRYMPPRHPNDAVGIPAMVERWKDFLDEEALALKQGL